MPLSLPLHLLDSVCVVHAPAPEVLDQLLRGASPSLYLSTYLIAYALCMPLHQRYLISFSGVHLPLSTSLPLNLLDSVCVVHAPGLPAVLDQLLALVPPLLLVNRLATQPGRDTVQLLVLKSNV